MNADRNVASTAQGPWTDLALHTLGWKAFQDLSIHVCEEILRRPLQVFNESKDEGQDGTFLSKPLSSNQHSGDATVQVKFTSSASRQIKATDIGSEEEKIAKLVADGRAETYVLITNMPISSAVAHQLKAKLRRLGVKHPHVFGKQFMTLAIRRSSRLRALVPRVYGLGDLSTILDERHAEQTRALLGHMLSTLKVYVPTKAHVSAIRVLAEHGLVLLLGDPATGKSTIAAILATIAAEDPHHRCYKVEGPLELIERWNPNERGGFYWIDDAFGPNQMREDYVDKWIEIMPKVQAAIAAGNRFVLTSRRHIYEATSPKLGSRNHPLFRDRRAIVDVGALEPEERQQILYNHIKAGGQDRAWRSAVKPHLEVLAREHSLLPEIARRLADPSYTRSLTPTEGDLLGFVREPKDHLLQIIRELPKKQRSALILVFLHRGQMPVGRPDQAMQQLVMQFCGVDVESLGEAVRQLSESFLVQKVEGTARSWVFKHPTLADAISEILSETDGMGELFLRGTKLSTILAQVVCGGAAQIKNAIIIPEVLNPVLIERLSEIRDEPTLNRFLFSFLHERASDAVFKSFIEHQPAVLARTAIGYWYVSFDPRINAHARAHRLGMLPKELREQTVQQIEKELVETCDTSFLGDDDILGLFPPSKLIAFGRTIRSDLLPRLPDIAESIAKEADLDGEPEQNFDELRQSILSLKELFEGDEQASRLLKAAEDAIVGEIQELAEKQEEKKRKEEEEEAAEDYWRWEEYGHRRASTRTLAEIMSDRIVSPWSSAGSNQSIFSDVDD
jgi:hypothetical protein